MTSWIAIGLGAADLRGIDVGDSGAEAAIIPARPADPVAIGGAVADLWRRMVAGPVEDAELDENERALVHEFADYGIASDDGDDPARIRRLPAPWLVSFIHELVYALVARVAAQEALSVVFIKGPIEYRQGLRSRRHSGDVDVWVEPGGIPRLAHALEPWGWNVESDPWDGTAVNHTATLKAGAWGCEIDLHRHFPGCALPADQAFAVLRKNTESMSFCGVKVEVPTAAAHSVIIALHLVRPEVGQDTSPRQIAAATSALARGGAEAAAFAREFRAEAALLEPLRAAFPDQTFEPSYGLPANWTWRAQPNRFRSYLAGLRMVPIGQRPRTALRLLWPADDVALHSEAQVGDTDVNPLLARFKRLSRGIRSALR